MGFDNLMPHTTGGDGAELQPGTLVGSYRVERLLGKGGMGEVYLAQHIDLQAYYALKVLPQHLAARPSFFQQFRQEAQVLARLEHPNIVRVTHFGVHEGIIYLAMEYLPGDDVEKLRAKKGGKLPVAQVCELTEQVLRGLAYAHKQGVVHRDLKPANLLIGSDGAARISDFGLAALVRDEMSGRPTAATKAADAEFDPDATIGPDDDGGPSAQRYGGTLDYMSPEAREGKPVGPAGDIYSLGVMTHFLLTGSKPGAYSKPASKMVRGVGRDWDKFLERCIAPDPKDRFKDASEALAYLPGSKVKSGGGGGALAWIAAAVVLLVGASAAAYFGLGKDKVNELLAPITGSGSSPVSEQPAPSREQTAPAETTVPPGTNDAPPTAGTPSGAPAKTTAGTTPEAPPRSGFSSTQTAATPVTISFVSEPAGATVAVNGRVVGQTPVDWSDGRQGDDVSVEVTAMGYKTFSQQLRLAQDGQMRVRLDGLPGSLSLVGLPARATGATIKVNGAIMQPTGGVLRDVPPGNVFVEISHPSYAPFSQSVTVPPGGNASLNVAMQPAAATLVVRIKPRITSSVTVNGRKYTAQGGTLEVEVPSGEPLELTVSAPYHNTVTERLELNASERQELDVVLLRK